MKNNKSSITTIYKADTKQAIKAIDLVIKKITELDSALKKLNNINIKITVQ